jgi:hypothetical protein
MYYRAVNSAILFAAVSTYQDAITARGYATQMKRAGVSRLIGGVE